MGKGTRIASPRPRGTKPTVSAVERFMQKAFKASLMNQPGPSRGPRVQVPRPGANRIRTVRGV